MIKIKGMIVKELVSKLRFWDEGKRLSGVCGFGAESLVN